MEDDVYVVGENDVVVIISTIKVKKAVWEMIDEWRMPKEIGHLIVNKLFSAALEYHRVSRPTDTQHFYDLVHLVEDHGMGSKTAMSSISKLEREAMNEVLSFFPDIGKQPMYVAAYRCYDVNTSIVYFRKRSS
jgi:isocitrate dehydrogenase kinase/phosphatase